MSDRRQSELLASPAEMAASLDDESEEIVRRRLVESRTLEAAAEAARLAAVRAEEPGDVLPSERVEAAVAGPAPAYREHRHTGKIKLRPETAAPASSSSSRPEQPATDPSMRRPRRPGRSLTPLLVAAAVLLAVGAAVAAWATGGNRATEANPASTTHGTVSGPAPSLPLSTAVAATSSAPSEPPEPAPSPAISEPPPPSTAVEAVAVTTPTGGAAPASSPAPSTSTSALAEPEPTTPKPRPTPVSTTGPIEFHESP